MALVDALLCTVCAPSPGYPESENYHEIFIMKTSIQSGMQVNTKSLPCEGRRETRMEEKHARFDQVIYLIKQQLSRCTYDKKNHHHIENIGMAVICQDKKQEGQLSRCTHNQ